MAILNADSHPTLGLIGYGSICREVVSAYLAHDRRGEIAGILVRPNRLSQFAGSSLPAVSSFSELLARKPGIVAEVATQEAVREYAFATLDAGIDLLITSTGALSDPLFLTELKAHSRAADARVLLAAGAIGGMDALAAMRLAGLRKVTYRSSKPPIAWKGTSAENLVDLDTIKKPVTFYRGDARAAAGLFPKNANVAATIALVGAGMDDTFVELVADPQLTSNIHELEAIGRSGTMSLRMDGVPHPDNARTSLLAAYSVADALLNGRALTCV
jgi:aspartate dehydrogenase